MVKKTLSQKIIDIVGNDPDSFDKVKVGKLRELLKPVNHEISVEKVTFRERKSTW